jgi:hypothetical protein
MPGYSGNSAIISPPLLHRETHCLRAAASLTPHPPLDHCLLACLTCHTEDGSELALGLWNCRAALTPPDFLDAFVNDSQERRETCKQAEEKIQVGMVPFSFSANPVGESAFMRDAGLTVSAWGHAWRSVAVRPNRVPCRVNSGRYADRKPICSWS